MAIGSPESIDLEAQRAELEAVLRSEPFTRAPTLANLLSYLCEKLFAGEAYQIKEYSVGIEVFHRGSSFDQDSDSIVRVEANRLRKRLAAYYAGDGASHRIRITIPLGQYVPEFKTVVPEPMEEQPVPAGPQVSSESEISHATTRQEGGWLRVSGRLSWWIRRKSRSHFALTPSWLEIWSGKVRIELANMTGITPEGLILKGM